MNYLKIPGMALSVVNSTNILYNKGYGYASLEENKTVNPDTTIFRIGSVSKLFTWTAVMQLYEQGLLDLDEDVNTYLSAFKIKKKFNQPITMKHLLTHSAGFEADWIWNGDATEETLLSLEDYIIQFQ
ncbi:MAG: beta-lactamase family protein, partial [Candidatus Heimdallarchaeota archaeon]|nr:beta-lactamase family protein [Candidatus Heimdallarchaeota archaeon]